MTIDEKALEALAKEYHARHQRDYPHLPSWDLDREDNKQYCRDKVIKDWLPITEVYESTRTTPSACVDDGKLQTLIMQAMEKYAKDEDKHHPDEFYVEGEAGYIIEAIRPYLRTTEPVSVAPVSLDDLLSCIVGYQEKHYGRQISKNSLKEYLTSKGIQYGD